MGQRSLKKTQVSVKVGSFHSLKSTYFYVIFQPTVRLASTTLVRNAPSRSSAVYPAPIPPEDTTATAGATLEQ